MHRSRSGPVSDAVYNDAETSPSVGCEQALNPDDYCNHAEDGHEQRTTGEPARRPTVGSARPHLGCRPAHQPVPEEDYADRNTDYFEMKDVRPRGQMYDQVVATR